MTNPSYVPHLMGITLDSTGVAYTQVTATNRTTGDFQVLATDANKLVVFDAANFTSGYTEGDIIDFNNAGGSVGTGTITIDDGTGDFQEVEITCAAASTVAITL